MIEKYLHIAGIRRDSPDYGLQWNLTHASLGDLGIRNGLDHRVKSVLRARGLGEITQEGLIRCTSFFQGLSERLQA